MPSQSNFVLAEVGDGARGVHTALKQQNILVRYFDAPRLDRCLRITVGTPEQNDRLLEALGAILQTKG